MPLQATSGAASYDGFGGGVVAEPNYIESVFSTYLYTGTGANQTITNGIDESGKGGMTWIKCRTDATSHALYDTERGAGRFLTPNATSAQSTSGSSRGLSSFNSTGFSLDDDSFSGRTNQSGQNYASWTFRKQPKFFDVVTYTGNGVERTIAHNLGSVPACIIVKRTDTTSNWTVYHRELNSTNAYQYYISLNLTSGKTADNIWGASPTSAVFTVTPDAKLNASGGTYVAYLFAHNAGGFGLTGTDNVISCGSFVNNAAVTLGYEPQWILAKRSDGAEGWFIFDTMRGMPGSITASATKYLYANTTGAEASSDFMAINATGFTPNITGGAGVTYIYIAIRRGPMKVPTSGTSVYNAIARTGTGAVAQVTGVGFSPDFSLTGGRSGSPYNGTLYDRLRGAGYRIGTRTTAAEGYDSDTLTSFNMNGVSLGADNFGYINTSGGIDYINWYFKRAPGFFDEVCYTGTGSARTITHNLAAVPELMIVKCRSTARAWPVYAAPLGNTEEPRLNESSASGSSTSWNSTTPTSSVFSVSNGSIVNASGDTYVAYLFATCAGVSKCTAFTGTGTLQTINCGFTSGARFVLIKRTDSTGDWYVWDSSRGLSSSTDPYLLLNSTAAEVTSTNWVDTTSTGFQVTAASGNNVNINGASYIALAIA